MSQGFTTELKVGLFVVAGAALLVFGYVMAVDGLRADESAYTLHLRVPSATGLWVGTPVKLAGVDIGAIDAIAIDGNQAALVLEIRTDHRIPTDSVAELRSAGMLGDRFVAVDLGRSESMLPDGGRLGYGEPPGDLDVVTRQVQSAMEDVEAITTVLREVVEDDANRRNVEATLANVEALSESLRLMAEANRRDVDAIVDSVLRLSQSLESFTAETSRDVDAEMTKLHDATDRLDAALADIRSITQKIDGGEGTLGALVNDDATIDALNETIDNANAVIESFSGLHAEVYYLGRLYAGTQPSSGAFYYGNPLAPNLAGGLGTSGSNTLGIELHPQEDFWWIFEINDYPQGTISSEQHYFPETGTSYTEWTRDLTYRFTFQMSKRWYNLALRLGVKESGGGIGATWYAARSRVQLNADVFDFQFGSYPALEASGLPNLRLATRLAPIDHIWLEAGAEQVLLGIRYNYATAYVGAGFHFTDDDIKLLFATLPLGL